ncbi:MAG: phosphate acyltransferase PlsX [Oscillospiraceae bacterium]|nr:phosphate acyltransferase PlsX [Oscillospiraceae bacterium]
MKIIVDGFGGDNAPLEVLKGCRLAADEYNVEIIITGKEDVLLQTAKENNISLDNIKIANAPDVITMHDAPTDVLKVKANSSLSVGMRMLANGEGDAIVSAGNTGAVAVGATSIVKRIKGIKRGALAPVIPNDEGRYMLIDSGANVECRPEMLVQFGIMGSIYMNKIMNVQNPRVGLANIGVEETKGTDLQIEAYSRLKQAPINFVGNAEIRDIPLGGFDVIVADGFTGNVILKHTEGLAKALLNNIKAIMMKNIATKLAAAILKPGLYEFKKKMDYKETGGAIFIGVTKPVIKAHGSSDAKAFKNAIRQAILCCENNVCEEISQTIKAMNKSDEE